MSDRKSKKMYYSDCEIETLVVLFYLVAMVLAQKDIFWVATKVEPGQK